MNSFFPILNWAGLLLLKEKLSHCTPYQEAERDSRAPVSYTHLTLPTT